MYIWLISTWPWFAGGRGVSVGPIVSNYSDIFCDNERGPNFLFENNGDGTFNDIANEAQIPDSNENGRGVTLSDFNNDGKIDIAYGNWNGPHRLFLQESISGYTDEILIEKPKFRVCHCEFLAVSTSINIIYYVNISIYIFQ